MASHTTRKTGTAARQRTIAHNAARAAKRGTVTNRAGHVRTAQNRTR